MCFPSFAKDRIDYIANDGKCWSTFIYIFFETSLRFQCKLHFVENKGIIILERKRNCCYWMYTQFGLNVEQTFDKYYSQFSILHCLEMF